MKAAAMARVGLLCAVPALAFVPILQYPTRDRAIQHLLCDKNSSPPPNDDQQDDKRNHRLDYHRPSYEAFAIRERFGALEGSDALTAIVESTLDSYTEVAKERRATYLLTKKNDALQQQLREQRRKESNEKRSGDFEKRMENKLDAFKDELTAAMNQQSAELTKKFEENFAELTKNFEDKFTESQKDFQDKFAESQND
ncbi:hypothetical protein JKP88DRAFT_310546 [Tribonema minus]|uniref:Uncharacterized protein n=1 Tax=Tribonema minus TaxID=303371 RepID=A0A836CGS8_9STRA|nr:hypothetical protein JKP88DRAFT_310546 [Tribonema minus]